MENIIEEIRQNEINLLKEEGEININDNIEFNKTFNNKGNIYNINNNKSQKLNSYSDYSLKYKPIFIKGKEKKVSKKKPKKNYETILVENSKNNSNINAPQLFNILNETQKQNFISDFDCSRYADGTVELPSCLHVLKYVQSDPVQACKL
jgi:hypothetical protein